MDAVLRSKASRKRRILCDEVNVVILPEGPKVEQLPKMPAP
jgi:hypothetical protein